MTKFEDYLNSDWIFEGIDIDFTTKTVIFNGSHENIVDTSTSNNPSSQDNSYFVFKRKKGLGKTDGNPLFYALKNEKGWKMSDAHRNEIWNRVEQILSKLPNDFDVLVMPPSSSSLMKLFKDKILDRFKDIDYIENCLLKRTTEEVWDDINFPDFTEDELLDLDSAFQKMNKGYFEAKHFHLDDDIIKKFETSIFKTNPESRGLEIYGKKVLVLDDIYSRGFTLSKCAKTITENYFPKSVHNVMLLSGI